MKKALFLDRDGVINKDTGYVSKYEDIEYVDGIFEVCKYFQLKGYKIVIVTNQSGIGRGYFSQNDFEDLMRHIIEDFNKNRISILDFFFCPHMKGAKKKKFDVVCECRKPKPGMILNAIKLHRINPSQSFLIGDNLTDVQAGLRAKLKKVFLFSKNKTVNSNKVKKIFKLIQIIRYSKKGC